VIATIMSRAVEEAAGVLTETRIRIMGPETIGTVAATTTTTMTIVAADSSRMFGSGRVTMIQRMSKTLLKRMMRYTGDKSARY
jgi:succinyl-CoA synthetase alpha subunit